MLVRRTLPHRTLRTVGAFCFVDHYGPTPLVGPGAHPMVVAPHPHTGLQTVSWLLSGDVEHRDSVGSIQRIQPGDLNLMTAGEGIAHSEYSVGTDDIHGVQLWVALPDRARHQTPHFEHHADLPNVELDGVAARVVMGEFAGATSPALTYSRLICAELRLSPGAHDLPLDTELEHGLLLLAGDIAVNDVPIERSALRYLPWGSSSLQVASAQGATALLLGGEPFDEELLMWWNFVGRTHEEIEQARQDWTSQTRFRPVVDDTNEPIPAPEMPTTRLRSRPSRP